MASFNKVILLGNLTREPQLSYLPSQTPVCDFGLAMNRKFTAQDGSQRDEPCFVDCRIFGKRAEILSKYVHKGSPLFVEGRLSFESWTAQDGSKRSRLRVTVEDFQFVGGAQQGGQGGGSNQYQGGGGNYSKPAGAGYPQEAPQQSPQMPPYQDPGVGMNEDDIPF